MREIYPEGTMIVRASQVQSPARSIWFLTLQNLNTIAQRIREGEKVEPITRVGNQLISPITGRTLARALDQIIKKMHEEDNFRGVIHVSSTNAYSSADTCRMLAEALGLKGDFVEKMIVDTTLEKVAEDAKVRRKLDIVPTRPKNSILDVNRFIQEFGDGFLHPVEEEILRFLAQYRYLIEEKYPDLMQFIREQN